MHLISSRFGWGTTYAISRNQNDRPPPYTKEEEAYKYIVDTNAPKSNHKKFRAEVLSRTPRRDVTEELPEHFVNIGTFNSMEEAVRAIENYRKGLSWDFNYCGGSVGRVQAY